MDTQSKPITERHVAFLQARGYPLVDSVEAAQKFVGNINEDMVAGFHADFERWANQQDQSNPYLSIRGRRRPSIRDRRKLQGSLEGVKLITAMAIQDETGARILPGVDVTEKAKSWNNLPTLIKRGQIIASPGVDHTRIQIQRTTVPSEQTAERMFVLTEQQSKDMTASKGKICEFRKEVPTIAEVMDRLSVDEETAKVVVVQQEKFKELAIAPYGPNIAIVSRESFDGRGPVSMNPADVMKFQCSIKIIGARLPVNDLEAGMGMAMEDPEPDQGKPNGETHPEPASQPENAPGGQGDAPETIEEAMRVMLTQLSDKDSAKNVRAVLSQVMEVPEKATKAQMLAMRDKVVATDAVNRAQPAGEEGDAA